MKNAARPTVGIFTEGTATGSFLPTLRDTFGRRAVFELGTRELRDPAILRDIDLLVLPGVSSEDSHYPEIMTGETQSAIFNELHKGMDIWMSCAPVYLSSKIFSYESPYKTVADRAGLGLLEGRAWGPVDGNPPVAPERTRFSDTRVVMVEFNDRAGHANTAGICYSNGPAYIPAAGENIEMIAQYRDVPGKPLAAGAKIIGKGVAVFSGVLPEMAPAEMRLSAAEQARFPHLARLYNDSLPFEPQRKGLLDVIVNKFQLR